jgi:hypothetical protein
MTGAGGVAERSNAAVSKTVIRASGSEVQILSPPLFSAQPCGFASEFGRPAWVRVGTWKYVIHALSNARLTHGEQIETREHRLGGG